MKVVGVLCALSALVLTQINCSPELNAAVDQSLIALKNDPLFRDTYFLRHVTTRFTVNEDSVAVQGTLNFTNTIMNGFKNGIVRAGDVQTPFDDRSNSALLVLLAGPMRFSSNVKKSFAGEDSTYLVYGNTSDVRMEIKLTATPSSLIAIKHYYRGFNEVNVREIHQANNKTKIIIKESAQEGLSNLVGNQSNPMWTALFNNIATWEAVRNILLQ